MKLLRLKNVAHIALTTLKLIFSVVAIAAGATGLFLLYVSPVRFLIQFLPIHIEGTVIRIDQVSLQAFLSYLDANLIATIAGSFGLILLGLLVHAHDFRAWARAFRAAPMAALRSPITLYRRIVIWRDWILGVVERANAESAKWKTVFNVAKSPYSLLRALGFSPQMAAGLLTVTATAGSGVVVNETLLAERSFAAGDSGVYSAPRDTPTSYSEKENTLRIDLGTTPVREITIENVSVGTVFTGSALPSGEQNVVDIGGNVVTGGTNTRLEVGHLIFERSRCKKLELTDIQAHTLIVRGNASDGQSIAPAAGTSRMRAIGGGHHQADAMVTSGGTYDRILIQAPTSAVNGKVDTLTLSNLYTKGGICALYRMNVGTLEILLNEVGEGNGFGTKEFVIATNVTAANITVEDNVETTITEPATL